MGGNKHPEGIPADPVNQEQLELYARAEQAISEFSAPIFLDSERPNDRLFVATFDGTRNSMFKDALENHTNVARLASQVEALASPVLRMGYVEGPGTQGGLNGLTDAALGTSYEARIEMMYLQFVTQAKLWIIENPDAEIRMFATGFSRGAEQVAGFTRLVEQRGIQDPANAIVRRDADGLIVGKVIFPNPPLREPGSVVQSVGLFDPVGSGEPRRNDRRLASTVVVGLQIDAIDERRNLFPSTSIIDRGATSDGRFLNIAVAGAHSDIGGGYTRNGLSTMYGNVMIDYFNAHVRPPPLEKYPLPDASGQYVVHQSQAHSVFFGTSFFDRVGERRVHEVLSPPALCRIDCRDAMPRNEAMAASVEWQPVTIGPVQGSVPVRSEGLDTQTFVKGLLSAASREDGFEISRLTRGQVESAAGQAWLQGGFDVLERQLREQAARTVSQTHAPALEPAGP